MAATKGHDGLEVRDADAIAATIPTVSAMVTVREGHGIAEVGEVESRLHLAGTGPGYLQLLRDAMEVELTQGRFLTAKDEQTSAQVVVLDEALASALFPDGNPVGHDISIGKRSLSVVGVLRTDRHSFFDDIRRDAYMPASAFNAEGLDLARQTQAELDRIWVNVVTVDRLKATQTIINNLISKRHPAMEFSVR